MTRPLLPVLLLLTVSVCAAAGGNHQYARSAAGQALLQHLDSIGVDVERARALLADAVYQPEIVEAMRTPAESTLTWQEYRPIFLGDKRIRAGAAFIRKYQSIFDRVEQTYGVPAPIIAAIIGVETYYGNIIGDDRVLDALATLAFDYPPRSAFFTEELGHFIQLCVEENLDCRHEVGSYAGAMGWPQFIASSYRAYAVDFNHNGSRDLWNEPGDIIASVANYLNENGWRSGERVALAAKVSHTDKLARIERSRTKTHYSWAELAALGVQVAQPPTAATPVGLLQFEGAGGTEYWVGLPNFFVITTYNHSPLYAMAVYQLGREIAQLRATQDGESP